MTFDLSSSRRHDRLDSPVSRHMTSTSAQQNSVPASNSSASTSSTPSYASAAGAAKKPQSTPVVATGSSASAPHHAKSSSTSPLNGRPSIMPAVPPVSAASPAVAHGTSSANGESHARDPSVTLANGPSGASAPKNIQFGFQDSPAASHSSPQPGSAPIAIPGGNPRVTSPQNSPSPIPQPSATGGGRPLSGAAPGNAMTFGSFGGDSERPHMRTASSSQDPNALASHASPHMRRSSSHSHNDMGSQQIPPQPGMGRGGFPGAGRGRGSFNNYNQPNMGYPPGPNFGRGAPNQGRGGMPPNFNPNSRQPPFGTPPQAHRSPAMNPAIPHQQPPNVPPNNMPGFYYPPPPMGPTQVPQNFYQNQYYDPNMRGNMQMGGYPGYPMMHGQGSPAPNFQQPYGQGPYAPPGGQPMSRQGSQVSTHEHRPASSASQGPPSQGTPQTHHAQIKPAIVSSPQQFTRPPKKSAALIIKNPQGETVDLAHLKAPASPAPSSQQSKTPPVVASTPPPPAAAAKPPAHARSESSGTTKTAEEVRNEFKEKMKQAAMAEKAKDEAAAKAKEAETAAAAEKEKAAAEEKAKAEEAAKAAAAEKAKAEEAKKAEPAPTKEEPAKAAETEEEELERIIREMEEADAKREADEEERRAKRKVEDEAKKKKEEEDRKANAAANDQKLRDAEAEMERLEEEREAKRRAASSADVQALLKGTEDNKTETPSTDEAADKLAKLSIEDKPGAAATAKSGPGGRGNKPAALNLAPLKTNSVEPPQPSAALQSLKTARLLDTIKTDIYPAGIQSPNPALNAAVSRKGTSFKYDPSFLLQFKSVFTEQPSLDFNQQVKSLIGDGDGGRSASARTPASGRQPSKGGSGFPMMGSFGATTRTLPPGTTSEQRMAMSAGSMPRPAIGGPIQSFRGPGSAFPGGSSMARSSSSSMGSHSGRQGSKGGRHPSKQNTGNSKQEAQAAKTMPLTAGMKIEALNTSTTGWKPTSIGKPIVSTVKEGEHMDPAMVQRKVKAALNKMTPENFEKISEQILTIAAQSKDETDGRTLRQVIQLTFEKATDEAHWASMYAKFCKRMLETMSPDIRDESIIDRTGQVVSGGNLFRKYLLNRCQEEFERGWKTNLPEPKEAAEGDKKSMEAVMLSEEYYIAAALKRRGLGLVQFIGELYKLGMLTERIMHECVKKLVDYSGVPDEAEIESLSKLLRTIGGNLDATEKGRVMMDVYFARIQSMVDHPELPSRLKFMLMDIIDLRRANWVSKEANKGPKTLEEVRAEAEAAAAAKAAEAARSSQRGGPGRPQLGRGDARGYNSGFPQPAPNQIGMDDLRRLKGGANRTSSSGMTLGPMNSMLNSRSNSGRRLGSAMTRGNEDSAASSRNGTASGTQKSTNAFEALAGLDTEHPTSPPSTAASPALAKVAPEATAEKESS